MNYRNVVTVFAFLTVWGVMFLVWYIHQTSDTGNRYQIVNTDNAVVLLDKRTGITWRNVWNDDNEKIPHNWLRMNYNDDFIEVPIGIQEIRQNMIKGIFKEKRKKKEK